MSFKIVYEPEGRALEYSDLACNLYNGCSHGCVYCYVPAIFRKTHEEFSRDPVPVKDFASRLEYDFSEMNRTGDKREVMFSFTTDPFQPCEERFGLMRTALDLCCSYGIVPKILTKGRHELVKKYYGFMRDCNANFGVTLLFDRDLTRSRWEPEASTVYDRIANLVEAKNLGIRTWVSVEPVIVPEEALGVIREVCRRGIADVVKVGKLNHCKQYEDQVNWPKFREEARAILEKAGVEYCIKKDLEEAK